MNATFQLTSDFVIDSIRYISISYGVRLVTLSSLDFEDSDMYQVEKRLYDLASAFATKGQIMEAHVQLGFLFTEHDLRMKEVENTLLLVRQLLAGRNRADKSYPVVHVKVALKGGEFALDYGK